MKLLHQKILRKIIILLLFLPAISAWGQSFTISRGIDGTQNTVTGINVTFNGVTSCITTPSNQNVNLQMVLTAQPGYSFTITSIDGKAVRSGSGKNDFNFQLINNGTVNGTKVVNIPSSSNCGGVGTTVPNIIVPAANQTVTSGATATINIIRGVSNSVTGGGYSHMKTFNVTGVVTGPTPPTITGNATQAFTFGTAGSYNFTLAGSPAPTLSATLDPSGALPAGITLDSTNKQIDVSNAAAIGTYDIILSATNASGTDTQNVTLTVNKGNQTIGGFTTNIVKAYGDPDFNLNATATSGLAVTYISSDPDVATISGSTVTVVGVGTADITASQAGNTNYNAATDIIRTLTVNKANQTISNFADITKIYGDADFNLGATATSGEAVTYVSSDTNVATISGNTVTIVGVGVTTITASQAGNDNYNAGSLARTLTVNKISQTITFNTLANVTYGDADFNLTATTDGASGEPVIYVSSNPLVATVLGNTVTITGTGTTNITASQAGNANYNAAINVIRSLTVDPKTITVTGTIANNKPYDGNTTATLSGTVLTASDIVGSDIVSLGTYTAIFNDASVNTNKPVAITYQLTGAQAARYILTQPTGITAEITTKQLTITGIQIDDKYHDGNTSATITGTPVLNGIVNSENVTIDSSITATAVFSDPNVNNAIPVIVSGYTLTGTNAGNYTLQQPQGLVANIIDVTLQNQTITFGALANVAYGDADFNLTATASSGLAVTYTSSDTSVATVSGNTVTILNIGTTTITANQMGDTSYNPAPAVTQQLTVNPKTLIVTSAAVADKTYNQTTTAVASGTLSGVINSDDVTLVSAATFVTDSAGNNVAVTPQYSVTGTDIAKYTLTQPVVTGNILPVPLTITNAAANNKAYDSNTTAVVTGTLSGILSGDIVTLNGTGTFADANVADGIVVTSTSTLAGADAANYTLTQPTGLTANITLLALTVNATADDKVYNRTTDATITVSQINGLVPGDDVTVTGGGTFNNLSAGNNKPVTANLTLTGTDAVNYTFTQPTGLTATITRKDLTIDTAVTTIVNKIYNNTTSATLANVTLIGVVTGDEANVNAATGTFAQATPGTGIIVSNVILSGSASINYLLTQPTTLTGTILPKELTLTTPLAQNKVYDGNNTAVITGGISGKLTGDVVNLSGTGTFASTDVANGIVVTSTATLTGANATNYTLVQPIGLTANITAKPLAVTATALDKQYDKTTVAVVNNAQLVASGIIGSDDVTLVASTVAGTFVNATVGNNKNVTASFTLQGTDAANYSVATQTYQASITPITLTADITSAAVTPKTYDATTGGAVITGALLNGILGGDTVNLSGTFASANVGTGIAVTLALTGTSAVNYTLTQPSTGLSGEIIKKTLIATADNITKTQGTANPTLTMTYTGFAGGQTAATAAGFVAPSIATDAGTSTPVGAYPVTITGGSADNYTFSLVNGWMIIVPPVNIVFVPGTLWSNAITDGTPFISDPFTIGQSVPADTYINVSGVGRGAGIAGTAAGSRYNANGWAGAFDSTDYFYFTITPAQGYKINFTSFTFTSQASGTGPTTALIRSSADNYTANIGTATVSGGTISLTGTAYQNITTATTFRVYAYGASAAGGTYSINDFSFSGSVVQVPVTAPPVITSALAASSFVGEPEIYQITATGTPLIAFNALNLPTGATIDTDGLITFDGTTPAGVYNINLKATSFYGQDINKVLVYTILKENQFLTFTPDPLPTKFVNDVPFVVTVTNTAPLAVTYSSSDPSVATVAQDGTITLVGVGTTTITASNTGDATYNAVNVGKTLTVLPAPQLAATPSPISFTAVQGQGPSAAVQLTSVTGINLVPASDNITLTVSAGFELAMGIGTYGSNGSFAYTGGAVNQTGPQIFVRLAGGQADGTYNGTLTISGGNATVQIPLTAIVEVAPGIITTATTVAPYCSGTATTISLPYTTQGTFTAGNYYVQLSDASGVFPNDFSNTISAPTTSSPITATLPSTLAAGNYRVRVIHLSSGLVLTSGTNDNGSDITINTTPAPTATALTLCNATTVASLTATGTDLKWYADAIGGTQLASTDAITTGNYFVSQTLNGCESERTQVAVTVNITPAPTATALTFCTATTVANLTATGTDLKWYADAIGGTQLASTDAVTTGNYFVSQTLNNCESTTTQVAVTVNITPAPTATALTFCTATTVADLTATGTDLKWYADAIGGTQLASTDAVTTGNYFVSQTLNNCESTTVQVSVTVNITPAPTATALTFCTATTVANLTATGTDLKWYADAIGGTQLALTDAITTGNYFVSQTLNSCESTRTQVAVAVNITPAPTGTALTFCTTATVANLTAIGTDLKWYANAIGGTQLALTDAVTTGNYFVSQTLNNCESTRTQISVTVNNTPAPTASALILCNTATVASLTATGTDLKWYTNANGGTQLALTDGVTAGNYFVSQTLNNCESSRTQVVITINTTPAPTGTALTFTDSATVADLTAIGTDLKWYVASTGGNQLTNATDLSTGSYFVSQTINGCESTRTEILVTINTIPSAPVANDHVFCNVATADDLDAEGTNLKWYATATGTTELSGNDALSTGAYYVTQTVNGLESTRTEINVTVNVTPAPTATPLTFCQATAFASNLTATGTNLKWYANAADVTPIMGEAQLVSGNYYVSQTLNDCESPRTEVAVLVNTTPAPEASALSFCPGVTVADLVATGTDLKWYNASTGGTVYTPETLLVSGDYYVSQTINECESARTLVTVTLTVIPMPIATDQTFCESTTVADLSATVTGTDLKWYLNLAGGVALTETAILTSGTYFVTQTLNGCESERKAVSVVSSPTTAPEGETEQLFTVEGMTIANLEAEGENIIWYSSEADAIAGTNPLADDTLLVTETTYYATQTVSGCESNSVLAVLVTITLDIDEVHKLTFSYFPNPVVDKLQITSQSTITNVSVYTLTGQTVMNEKWNAQDGTLNMSSLESGIYIVKINFGDIEKVIRVIRDK